MSPRRKPDLPDETPDMGDIAAHAAIPPAASVDDETSEEAGALDERPGEDLLESEGEALLPPSEPIEGGSSQAIPMDETVLSALHTDDEYDPYAVTEGELIRQFEELVPLIWLAMLLTVAYLGLYFAIDQLPNRGNPLPGPGIFF